MEIPAWLFKEHALGAVSTNKLRESEKLAVALSGGAAALMVGTALASPILAAAGAKGAERMMDSIDRMTFDRDLKKVLEVNKDIGKPDDRHIRLAYQSIRTTNPKFSKDPLIAGTLLRQIMQNRVDPYDPKSPARVDLNIASQLQGASGRGANDFVIQAAADSMAKLPASLLQANADLEAAAAQKAEADRRFSMSERQFKQKEDEFNYRQQADQRDYAMKQHTDQRDYAMRQQAFAETQRSNRMSDLKAETSGGRFGTGYGRGFQSPQYQRAKHQIRTKTASAGILTDFLMSRK